QTIIDARIACRYPPHPVVDADHVPRNVAHDLLEICPMHHYPADFPAEVCWQNILCWRKYSGSSFRHASTRRGTAVIALTGIYGFYIMGTAQKIGNSRCQSA